MKLEIERLSESQSVQLSPNVRLLDQLIACDIPVNAACGGKGTCHKCRVQVLRGFLAKTLNDEKAFSEAEIQAGWRLSCQARPKASLKIKVPTVQSFKVKPEIRGDKYFWSQTTLNADRHRLVCDLGSTGVSLAVIDTADQNTPLEAHMLNRQVIFGADVMTRLQAAQEGKTKELKQALHETVEKCLQELVKVNPNIKNLFETPILMAGNSAMTTFVHEWSHEQLAVSPFQPEKKSSDRSLLLSSTFSGVMIETLPLLAGFVGGDTVAGIFEAMSRPESKQGDWLLVDIGTNTEVVYWGKDRTWITSAPAGPAFEGGNIFKGMRAEPGAISEVRFVDSHYKFKTIGDDVARGICGSGLMDLIHEGLIAKDITGDGYLPKGSIVVTDEISLTPDDVREFQLAKSATRTAIDLLIRRAGSKPETLFLAGTFAQFLNIEFIKDLGLLPKNVSVIVLGNASLTGVCKLAALQEIEREKFYCTLRDRVSPIELALQDDFQEDFVRNLNFL